MNKPDHLGKEIGDQFSDKSIVENYCYRPSYTQAVVDTISNCRGLERMSVLDIGSGTGEISIPLSLKDHSVVGVDPSAEMIKASRAKGSNVKFVNSYIEDFTSDLKFDLFVAANSIHWPDWSVMFPLLKSLSMDDAKLVIVTGGELVIEKVKGQIQDIVKKYSTTRNFKPYSIVDMLENQGYIKNLKIIEMPAASVVQPANEYILSFHARNGFSLDRMNQEQAKAFDSEILNALTQNGFEDVVEGNVFFTITIADIAIP